MTTAVANSSDTLGAKLPAMAKLEKDVEKSATGTAQMDPSESSHGTTQTCMVIAGYSLQFLPCIACTTNHS